jgi:dipeptidyl-peptidase-4
MVCFQETDNSSVELFHIPDPIAPEKEPLSFYYPRPGRANAKVRLGLIDLKESAAFGGRKVTWIQIDADKFPYVATVVWPRAPDGSASPLTILVQNRSQTIQQLLVVSDLKTGETQKLLEVRDDKWLNLDQGFPAFFYDAGEWRFFFGIEEEKGWKVNLYDMPVTSGEAQFVETWVEPEAGFTKLIAFDEDAKTLYYRGGPNPTEAYVYAARKGKDVEVISERVTSLEGKAVEDATFVGTEETGRYLALVRTDLATMPTTLIFRCGKEGENPEFVVEVPSVAEFPGFKPKIEIAQLEGPKDKDFWTAVIRPHSAKKVDKLPIILNVYAGPHHLEVTHMCLPNLILQWLADTTNCIVVKLDGRGTPGRGRAWERAIKGDFVRVPVEDQCAGVKAIAATLLKGECVDVETEGIKGVYGWSYGGYMAAAMAMKSEEYGGLKVANAVAGAPVTEWLDCWFDELDVS